MMMQRLTSTIVLLSLLVSTSALLSTNRRNKKDTKLWAVSDRRVFLDASVLAGYTFFTSMPVGASDLDLSMPDEAQQIERQVRTNKQTNQTNKQTTPNLDSVVIL